MKTIHPVLEITSAVNFPRICYCYSTESESKLWPKIVFSVWRHVSGLGEREPVYNRGRGCSGLRVRVEVCVCVYVPTNVFIFWGGGLSLHWPHQSYPSCRAVITVHMPTPRACGR